MPRQILWRPSTYYARVVFATSITQQNLKKQKKSNRQHNTTQQHTTQNTVPPPPRPPATAPRPKTSLRHIPLRTETQEDRLVIPTIHNIPAALNVSVRSNMTAAALTLHTHMHTHALRPADPTCHRYTGRSRGRDHRSRRRFGPRPRPRTQFMPHRARLRRRYRRGHGPQVLRYFGHRRRGVRACASPSAVANVLCGRDDK